MRHHSFILLLCAGLVPAAHAGPSNMQPGLWEITTETQMPGMPMALPPQVIQHCYTAEELAQARNAVPSSGDGNCRISDYRLEGNTTTWRVACTGEAPMEGTGTMTTKATSYEGSMDSVMSHPGGTMHMTIKWRARRLGECR